MVDKQQREATPESVRPKRHTHPPTYFDDFLVDYGPYRPRSERPHLSTARYEHNQEQEPDIHKESASRLAAQAVSREPTPLSSPASLGGRDFTALPEMIKDQIRERPSDSVPYRIPVPPSRPSIAPPYQLQYRPASFNLPTSSTPCHQQPVGAMSGPDSRQKGRLCTSAPPTLYNVSIPSGSHTTPSYVVSSPQYYSTSRVSQHLIGGVREERVCQPGAQSANDMMLMLDKMMYQLQMMRHEVASKPATPSGHMPSHQPPYSEPPSMAYEYFGPQQNSREEQYATDKPYGLSDRFHSVTEPVPYYPMSQPLQRAEPDWLDRPYHPYKESATEYRGPKPNIPHLVHRDPSEFARLKLALQNLLPQDGSEMFKYQILVDHLQLEEAKLIADSFLNSLYPYTDTMAALTEKFGKPHQLALSKIASVMDAPNVRSGDPASFERFALQIQALVGLLKSLGPSGDAELRCSSHVVRLLTKLPSDLRAAFRRQMLHRPDADFTLVEFSRWLQAEVWCHSSDIIGDVQSRGWPKQRMEKRRDPNVRPATVLHGVGSASTSTTVPPFKPVMSTENPGKAKAYCPYCENTDHFLSQCPNFQQLTTEQVKQWIQTKQRCWKCGRSHLAAQCNLKKPCNKCRGKHLLILHDINYKPNQDTAAIPSSTAGTLYLDRPGTDSRVLLKVVKVLLRHKNYTLDTYAVLDDGSERSILLFAAAEKLNLKGKEEELSIRTIHQNVSVLQGSTVSFSISPATQPHKTYHIKHAFTAKQLGLAPQSYPMEALVTKYKHLKGLPIQPFDKIHPLLLIGADQPHLITPVEPVCLGPPGGPAAIKTRLGWTLQGPAKLLLNPLDPQQTLFTSVTSQQAELMRNVSKLWELDTLLYRSEKQVTRSREDKEALDLLDKETTRVSLNGVQRYATPLLRRSDMALLNAPKEAVMPHLRKTEKYLSRDPERSAAYSAEIKKLVNEGYVAKLNSDNATQSRESWFIPHHMVTHNEKHRLVFNCSFQYKGMNLNEALLPGPTLSASLLGVLIRFRERSVAVSGDIKGMFHQVRLLEHDKPILRFIWRDMERNREVDVYEWQVLPFGTTCSPCCASYALQKHVLDSTEQGDPLQFTIQKSFYVDNCLQSMATVGEAESFVEHLRKLLAKGGFEIRQWASNQSSVVSQLPKEAQSTSTELWLSNKETTVSESTLGLHWHCPTDTIRYKHRPLEYKLPTMRNLYRILASQYDPLGFILPYTTRAKILVQELWAKPREWDDPLLPGELLQKWLQWEDELQYLSGITLPRCYVTPDMDNDSVTREIHVFCDASERAYGAVSYLRTQDSQGNVQLAFLMARSRVAPKKQLSVPRLELCAALCGAQLAVLLKRELTLGYSKLTLWSDSTTVLNWLHSDSCRFKVFMGTRIAEIQETTDPQDWQYVDSAQNPADDLTRGKPLAELAKPNRWSKGPSFLLLQPDRWPENPACRSSNGESELRKSVFCALNVVNPNPSIPDASQFPTYTELLEATAKSLHDTQTGKKLSADDFVQAEKLQWKESQLHSFPEEFLCLQQGKPLPHSSRLVSLSPELDKDMDVIRVGGRLRKAEALDAAAKHPILLDPSHALTKLIIQDYDHQLKHPGSERVLAEIRRKFWILRGREAIRHHQFKCTDCRRWRAKPETPQMSDLPIARLQLFKPAFHSTGMDCFGPFSVKIGRRVEKRWGIIWKCLTTRSVHLDILSNIDTDSFLMALRRFVARRGTPFELWSDQGTNFKGGERELYDAFKQMSSELQQNLAKQKIHFHFNPPGAPHFGGAWEREIRSVKSALYASVGAQSVTEEVLRTVLVEVEGILNSKPLGYVSSDVSDIDPVTPNHLLMGRPDGSLPQVVYPQSEMISRKRWRQSQVLTDLFWSSFIRYYLPNLQTRAKWQDKVENIAVGNVVMLVDQQLPRALWMIGKVTKVMPSADGQIRTAEILIKDRSYIRPVARMIVLPSIPDDTVTS
ncbi:uncharacterized protein [Misgurnus anguillicaudatus]|uniref:uncharacterized protein n=1 Tax=Misgurnus anguillicaudatus TaxID=75329 RepID=UPI003CCF349B